MFIKYNYLDNLAFNIHFFLHNVLLKLIIHPINLLSSFNLLSLYNPLRLFLTMLQQFKVNNLFVFLSSFTIILRSMFTVLQKGHCFLLTQKNTNYPWIDANCAVIWWNNLLVVHTSSSDNKSRSIQCRIIAFVYNGFCYFWCINTELPHLQKNKTKLKSQFTYEGYC